MNIDTLKDELIADEGVKYEIYLDHLGYKTFGIGHLCRAKDPENDMEVGTEVSKERVDECFAEDIEKVIDDCTILYDDFYILPEEAQLIIANMMFNLGRPRLVNFPRCTPQLWMLIGLRLAFKWKTPNGQNKFQTEQRDCVKE